MREVHGGSPQVARRIAREGIFFVFFPPRLFLLVFVDLLA